MTNQIKETSDFLKEQNISSPEIGIILGTGLGNMVNEIEVLQKINYEDIPHFPVSTVESHKGKLIYGEMSGKKVLAMQGRFHYYEGYSMQEITFPVRVMKELRVKHLLISNACGALNLDYKKGSLMLIDDHINLLGDGPLIGPNHNKLGPRFPDMSQPYSALLNTKLKDIAKKENINLPEGVYVAVAGPNLETRAEYRFLRGIGADVVGMSTVPEAIVANHSGLPCAAISVITDECDPDNLNPVDLKDILAAAALAEKDLIQLFKRLIGKI